MSLSRFAPSSSDGENSLKGSEKVGLTALDVFEFFSDSIVFLALPLVLTLLSLRLVDLPNVFKFISLKKIYNINNKNEIK